MNNVQSILFLKVSGKNNNNRNLINSNIRNFNLMDTSGNLTY